MINKRLRPFVLFSLNAAVVWLVSNAAVAQSIDGAFKLGVEGRLFRFASITAEQGSLGDEETITQVELGLFSFGSAVANSMGVIGVPASSLGGDLAIGVGENFLVGSRLMVDYGQFKNDISVSATQFAIVPHLDYVFSTNSSFRPFLGVQFGAQGVFLSSRGSDISSYLFTMGCSLGGFAFIADNLSIDPRISFLYSLGSASMESDDVDLNSISIAVMIGLSGWI